MKLLKLLPIVLLSIALIGCENPILPKDPQVKCEVEAEINDSDLEVGDSTQVMANISSPNGSSCDSGVNWKVDNEEIVSITEIDKYTASIKVLEEGNTSITAESVDDSKAFDKLSIYISTSPAICEVSILKDDINLEVGDSENISASVRSLNDSNCQNSVIWSTNNDNIVRFDNITDTSVTVNTITDGSFTISAQSINDSTAIDNIDGKFTFTPIMIASSLDTRYNNDFFVNINKKTKKSPGTLWLPSGNKVSYVDGYGGSYDLVVVDLESNEKKVILSDILQLSEAEYDWNHDGSKIVMSMRKDKSLLHEIYSYDLNSEELKRLTYHFTGDESSGSYKIPHSPRWSPDGSKITFTSYMDGNWEIYSMNSDGSNIVNLTNTPNTREDRASWSPDGSKIAYIKERDNIWVMNADGSNQRQVSSLNDRWIFWINWSSDGSTITFSERHINGGLAKVWIIKPDGSNQEVFFSIDNQTLQISDWKPGFDASKL